MYLVSDEGSEQHEIEPMELYMRYSAEPSFLAWANIILRDLALSSAPCFASQD